MLLRQSVAYALSRGIAAVFTLVGIAVFSRVLSPAHYGDYTLLLASGTLVNVIGFQWIRVSALRYLPHYHQQRGRVLRTLLGAFVIVAVVVLGLGVVVLPFIPLPVVATTIVLALALAWFELKQDITRIDLSPWLYGTLTVLRAVLGLAFGYALVRLGLKGFGPVLGLAAAMLLSTLLVARNQLSASQGHMSKPMLVRFLGYGAPLVVAYAFDFVISTSDRFLLLWLSTREATGLYSAGYDLAFRTVGFATVVVGLAALPLAVVQLEREGPDAARAQLGKNRDALLAVTVPVVIVVSLFAENIAGTVLAGEFAATAASVIPLVAISAGVLAFKAYFADHAIHLAGRTGHLALVTASAALVNVVFNLWLIPSMGEVGAAISTLIAYLFGLIGALYVAHRLFGLPRLSADVKRVGLSGAVLLAVGWALRNLEGSVALLFQIAICAVVYGIALIVFDFSQARRRLGFPLRLPSRSNRQ